jgi:predicted metal-dependent HD superfamily phosphohydrolase
MSETNREMDTRAIAQDLIYDELRNIHGTLASIYASPSEQAKLIPHLKKIGKHIVDNLASIDERLCEANGLRHDVIEEQKFQVNQKHSILFTEKRLKVLRQQNDEMRVLLAKVYAKANEIVGMVGITNNLSNVLDQYNAKEGRWKKSLSLAKDIENIIPTEYYLPFGENDNE